VPETARAYPYVGPGYLARRARPGPDVITVTSPRALSAWLDERQDEVSEPFTFVIGLDGTLRMAPRRSEHIDCAAGQDVLAAGEIGFAPHDGRWVVTEISNLSTGYCPDPGSWLAVDEALERIGISHPGDFTCKVVFRQCPACRQRNIVKDETLECAVCGAALPEHWNISAP
jgi:hypothetical protein